MVLSRVLLGGVLLHAVAAAGGLVSAGGSKPLEPAWTVSLQGGYASTFQLMLGGTFGDGPDFQNKLTAGISNLLRNGDSLSLYGWSTTDLPSVSPNWQAGFSYKERILHKGRHSVVLGGGAQRWLFPDVKTGSNDWLATGTVNYATSVKHVPITVTSDSFSLLSSPLPLGSLLYTQIQTQHPLLKRGRYQLSLRHGPMHTYSWGFWGANGNRVVRYGVMLAVVRNNMTIEVGCRQQFGLQDKIPYNRFWTVLVSRQLSGRFHTNNDR
jgi:hypothetical protein